MFDEHRISRMSYFACKLEDSKKVNYHKSKTIQRGLQTNVQTSTLSKVFYVLFFLKNYKQQESIDFMLSVELVRLLTNKTMYTFSSIFGTNIILC